MGQPIEPALISLVQRQTSEPAGKSRKCLGLLTRKERWGLSARGWLLLALIATVVTSLGLFGLYPFLATTHRAKTNVLVVEGWVHRYASRVAAEEFKTGHYVRVFTTGGPVVGNGGYVNDAQTAASVGANLLLNAGLSREVVQMVPCRVMTRDRTYGSAIALRNWFRENNQIVNSFNIITEDAHARRTRLLFQKAFGPNVEIGIIAIQSPDYDATHWWRFSEGVRDVIGETIAYIYAKLFFHPAQEVSTDDPGK